jgi:periplasmic divalent cation tolerance protein
MEPVLLVLTNLPNRDVALKLARSVVDEGIAACVNVLSGCTSVYRWQGVVETAEEVPVLIKTRQSLYPRLEQAIARLHPYQLPEVIALPITSGLPAYLDWVCAQTAGAIE